MDSYFRAFLRGRGQVTEPTVMVGKNGYDERVAAHLDNALELRELVKVKFQNHKKEVENISRQLAASTNSTLVTTVGFTAVFYRDGENHQFKKLYKARGSR